MYPWVVIGHVAFVILAFGAHGVSAFAMFRVKAEPDRAKLAALLDLSQSALLATTVSLFIALVLGIVAAVMGNFFSQWWPWVSIVLLIGVAIAMTPLAMNPMSRVRMALGMPTRGKPAQPAGSDADVAAARAGLQPMLVATIGVVAIAVLVWLMFAKPF
jgi:hypothetical protein